MDFILDLQDMETPEAQSNAMASGGSSGGGGSTTASNLSLLGVCSHSTLSVVAC
ncbi:SapB/AmfS family lanthipeptide [Saccharothrix longispora]|uniref:Asp-tRNA(Asn)/Glu-tRNA(Gln) amidotransferase A subunit family amidase n=1 Tax=Saccharothrix longispora TaxID=33920 RepID=A0ABU1Q8E8_9PSEU|nr:SapB/AmfS family lanthipeptide [Saccharothrix longispora]MDR6598798.1 Asp-tRNA(Asn)/Glu-tRNA(Gln) amidotransferase A subunit family amidase [Saccharothrix longispora]MDU0294370.1 SapB/AmfS family lanthipeptide [Saccharothrix longispora]